ncbi:hypothetical protein BD414DRAFT_519600 [Trametes punicea]|nr:hypothetical protein BD414DRAFT_519600 [Trametes punicea]
MSSSRSQHARSSHHSPVPSASTPSKAKPRREPYVASGARRREEEERRRREEDRRNDNRGEERERRRAEDERDGDRRSRSPSRVRRPSSSIQPSSTPSHFHDQPQPATSSSPLAPPKRELTVDEKRTRWLDRIKLMSEAVQARSEHLRLQEDLQKYERLAKSSQFEALPEEDRDALKDLISATSSKVREKQHQLNRIAGQLIPEDFWPFELSVQQHSDPGYQRMTSALTTLQEDVKRLYDSLGSVLNSRDSTVAVEDSSVSALKPEPGELSAADSTGRPKKRRRLSIDEGPPPFDLSIIDLESMQDRLAALGHRIVDLRNDLLQYDSRVEDEVESQLGYRLSGLRIGVGGEDKPADPELQERVEKLTNDIALAQSQAAAAARELEKLQAYGKTRDETNARLQQGNEALRKHLEELESSQAEMSATVSAQQTEIGVLRAAVESYISRPSNPPPPGPLTADAIVEAIRPRLLDAAREELSPRLEDLRAHVEKQIQAQSDQFSGDLMTQIEPVMRSAWAFLEKIRVSNGAVPPATPSTVPGSSSADKGKGVTR